MPEFLPKIIITLCMLAVGIVTVKGLFRSDKPEQRYAEWGDDY